MGNKDNVIMNSMDDLIGYHKDLVAYTTACLEDYAKDEDWEQVKEMADLLLDLNEWTENENLLVLSENNGMGYTIREYKKGD